MIGLWIASLSFAAYCGLLGRGGYGMDSHAYWAALQTSNPYGGTPGSQDAFLYSPAFLQALRPFAGLSWPVFAWTWAVVEMLGLWWLTRPLAWRWRIPVLLLCFNEVQVGNVYTLLAIGLVVGFRSTSAWSVIPLTKVAPTLPLVAWLVARREWSRLASSCAWLTVIVALSVMVDPQLWQAWLGTLSEHAGGRTDFYGRLAMSIALALLAARLRAPWLLPLCLMLAVPTNGLSPSGMALLAAIPRLISDSPRELRGPPGRDSAASDTRKAHTRHRRRGSRNPPTLTPKRLRRRGPRRVAPHRPCRGPARCT